MKTKPIYDNDELEILQAWEAGEFKPVSEMPKQIKAHRAAAQTSHLLLINEASKGLEDVASGRVADARSAIQEIKRRRGP